MRSRCFNSIIIIILLTSISNAVSQSKYEPSDGCYIGAFIANDYNVRGDIGRFEIAAGKKHSMYLNYANYGDPFPSQWVKAYAATGAVVQIGFEPNGGLDSVKDSEYLRNWAIAARKSGAMILLRWASEMNGPWVAWYGDPQLYIQKFRLVHDIMAKYAPNVAMVWAPNVILNDQLSSPNYISSYYPGDQYVDWVGVDFYSTYVHSDGTPDQADPRLKLSVIYNMYSQKKPIIICEWGAALYTKRTSPPMSVVDFAISQIDSLYENVKTQFPAVKAICYFDYNATGVPSNLNDYCLTDSMRVLDAYAHAISSQYFLTRPFQNIPYVNKFQVVPDSLSLHRINVSGSVQSDLTLDSVVFMIDGRSILV
ncbi:MAG: glycoside hydrolase family 26 protein, partial [Candidatus Kryptoniota bacterium]